MIQENLAQFFQDMGVNATFSGQTAKVLFDFPDQIIAGDVISAEYRITYPKGTFPLLAYQSTIVVDTVAYRVNEVEAIEDGNLIQATLRKI